MTPEINQKSTDWLAVVEQLKAKATPGEWQGFCQECEPGEAAGANIGIMAVWTSWDRVTPHDVEAGRDPQSYGETAEVALLAWDEAGNEQPKCEENIAYITELHNRFDVLAAELRMLRAQAKHAPALTAAETEAIAIINAALDDESGDTDLGDVMCYQVSTMLDAVRRLVSLHGNYESMQDTNRVLVNRLLAAPQWVAVTERLPESGVYVALRDETDEYLPTCAYCDATRWRTGRTVWPLDAFTHWMPLPQAPATMEGSQSND